MDNETRKELRSLLLDIFKLSYRVFLLIGLLIAFVMLVQYGFSIIR